MSHHQNLLKWYMRDSLPPLNDLSFGLTRFALLSGSMVFTRERSIWSATTQATNSSSSKATPFFYIASQRISLISPPAFNSFMQHTWWRDFSLSCISESATSTSFSSPSMLRPVYLPTQPTMPKPGTWWLEKLFISILPSTCRRWLHLSRCGHSTRMTLRASKNIFHRSELTFSCATMEPFQELRHSKMQVLREESPTTMKMIKDSRVSRSSMLFHPRYALPASCCGK